MISAAMDSPIAKTPCRDGFWFTEKWPSYIIIIEGNKLEKKKWIELDYPDLGGDNKLPDLKFGDFGAARKELAEREEGARCTIEICWLGAMFVFKGVVNEDGTEMRVWNDITNVVDVFKWLTPEEVEDLKQGRDDFDAPR